MPRLLFFAPRLFAPGEISGAALTLETLRRHLADLGLPSVLLTDDVAAPAAVTAPATVHSPAPAASLIDTLRAHGAEAVVIWGSFEVGPAIAACRAARVPVVMYFQNCELSTYDHIFDRGPDILYLGVSRFAVERLRAWCGVDAQVVPPIIAVPPAIDGPHDRVLFVNPIPVKGCEIAFALAGRLREATFLIVESWAIDAPWRNYCLARLRPCGNVDWRSASADMATIWSYARVVLMPSVWEEAWGRVASEAQANGVPVVASTRGGLPEAVGPGGILLDVEAPLDEWAGALSRLLRDDAWHRRLADAARAHAARAEIQPQEVVRRFADLAARHIAGRRRAA